MHLYSPDRPEVSPGQKALLLDGSAVPSITVMPLLGENLRLSVMLNNYDNHGGYSWKHQTIPLLGIRSFFHRYSEDPEAALRVYFGWSPQSRSVAKASPPETQPLIANIEDLI